MKQFYSLFILLCGTAISSLGMHQEARPEDEMKKDIAFLQDKLKEHKFKIVCHKAATECHAREVEHIEKALIAFQSELNSGGQAVIKKEVLKQALSESLCGRD